MIPSVVPRPALSLQTTYLHESDRAAAQTLGAELYNHLTRPLDDPLGYGANIPVGVGVAADQIDLDAADLVVLVPVLGKTSYLLNCDQVLAQVNAWHEQLGTGRVLVVPTSSNWRNVEDRFSGKLLLSELAATPGNRRKTLDEIVLAIARLVDAHNGQESATGRDGKPSSVRLFVSHAKADLQATDDAAKKIHHYVVTDSTGSAFFDVPDLRPGESLVQQLDEAVTVGVMVAVRGDAYSSRAWCQRELLRAKLHKVPTLTVEVLRKGEARSSPYGGNGPSLVWDGDPAPIASRAMVEWLRFAVFRREARRIIQATGLPSDVEIMSRPPELLDLAQGPLQSGCTQLVLYPDPELPVVERQVLRAAQPRLQLVTPTTTFRRLLGRGGGVMNVSSPLEGMQVALSLSETPDADGPEGYTVNHLTDAIVYIARTLISAGAGIAYGGDFRENGFTTLLASLIQAYNQTATDSGQRLHSYTKATTPSEEAPDDLPLAMHHLVESPEIARDAIMPVPSGKEAHPSALYLSDMRRVMAIHTDARVILGGISKPRATANAAGYGGRYPGIVEEAWRTLQAGKPLYALGGFGGGAALVADLLAGHPIPEQLKDRTWETFEYFVNNAKAVDADPLRERLELPTSLEDLAERIKSLATRSLADDQASTRWNGLTLAENQTLFQSRDPVTLASLVMQGLLNVVRAKWTGKLNVELVHGSITTASELDAVAVATFDNVPLGGAGAVLDQAVSGRASTERASGRDLIRLDSADIDADWIFLASLGQLEDPASLIDRVEHAARQTAEQASRHGFERLGVVAFGGAVLADVERMAGAMLRGLDCLPPETTVVWFETNSDRFERLREHLSRQSNLRLTTQRAAPVVAASRVRKESLIVQVGLKQGELTITTLPPTGSAVASERRIPLSDAQLGMLAAGAGSQKRATPDLTTLQRRGLDLADTLFGKDAADFLDRCRDAKVVVIHDVPSSKLPFEMLATSQPDARPAVQSGISRRLAVANVPLEHLFTKPPKQGKLGVLLIINPTEDLPGTEAEGAVIEQILSQQNERVTLQVLPGRKATVRAVRAALEQADVLHYCGHAFFDGPGPEESGLLLAGKEPLTSADLVKVPSLPRVAFVNACEAGRVRGQVETEAAAFAELFLRSGVEAYLGTFWEVQDSAAASFSREVYSHLADGATLEEAVLQARVSLHRANEPDWANYILYGDGSFRLVVK